MARIQSRDLEKQECYMGMFGLKKSGVSMPWTKEMVDEFVRCADDPVYFIKTYCRIVNLDQGEIPFKMWRYQEDMVATMATNRFSIIMLPRQMGKTQTTAGFLLHQAIFNKHNRIAILANKEDGAVEVLDRIQFMYSSLPSWLQPGVVTWNKGDIKFDNGSKIFTAATSLSAIRGRSVNCVTGDTMVTIVDDSDSVYYTNIEKAPRWADSSSNHKYIHQRQEGVAVYYTVYEVTNKVNGKIYVGYHQTNDLEDGYLGSGKLIQRAVAKHGPAAFSKRYLGIFDNRDAAENLEAEIVNREFTLRDDTYNICLGGNVRIMVGKNNPFYGKTHTKETIDRITNKTRGMVTGRGIEISFNGKQYPSFYKLINENSQFSKTKKITEAFRSGMLCFVDVELQSKYHEEQIRKAFDRIENSKKLSITAKQRFTGKVKEIEHRKKISDKLKGRSRPYNQILNKDSEKIRKTAEKNTGSKRTEESRLKMSLARKALIDRGGGDLVGNGWIYANDPLTGVIKRFKSKDEIPDGWLHGNPRISSKGTVMYNNGLVVKKFKPGEQPEGWVKGMIR